VQLRDACSRKRAAPRQNGFLITGDIKNMNAIRTVMTFFLTAMLAAAFLGWRWAVTLPSPKLEAARAVLALAGIAAAVGITILWRVKPQADR
jgi:hypothetical protein